MLEEALQRASGGTKNGKAVDLGWRRWSDREGAGILKRAGLGSAALDGLAEAGNISTNGSKKGPPHHAASSSESDTESSVAATSPLDAMHSSPVRPTANPTPQPTSSPTPTHSTSESRFFKFRFGGGSGAKSTTLTRPGTPVQQLTQAQAPSQAYASSGVASVQQQHLTSASLPSLSLAQAQEEEDNVALKRKQRLEELEKLLNSEKEARAAALAEKVAMEEELEGLSAALFEEVRSYVSPEFLFRMVDSNLY